MKIYIFADMEGSSGIDSEEHVTRGEMKYQEGCEYFLMDVNACVEGCVKAGADEIVVVDGHGGGGNLSWKRLHHNAQLIRKGRHTQRLVDIEGSDALILLGYHARAGVHEAFLEHTYSHSLIQNMWVNGKLVGEFECDSMVAAEYGVPTIMVTGDDKVCAAAKAFISDIITCQVKKSYSTYGTKLLSYAKAHKLIEEKTIEAIQKRKLIKPPEINYPVTIRLEMVERSMLKLTGCRQIDARTVEFSSKKSFEQALISCLY